MSIIVPISCRRFVCGVRLFRGLQGNIKRDLWIPLSQLEGRSPANVTSTSRRTAGFEDRPPAADKA